MTDSAVGLCPRLGERFERASTRADRARCVKSQLTYGVHPCFIPVKFKAKVYPHHNEPARLPTAYDQQDRDADTHTLAAEHFKRAAGHQPSRERSVLNAVDVRGAPHACQTGKAKR